MGRARGRDRVCRFGSVADSIALGIERKRAQTALAESEARFNIAFQASAALSVSFRPVTTSGEVSKVAIFNGTNGAIPFDGLVQGPDGSPYGTTAFGGPTDAGTTDEPSASRRFTRPYLLLVIAWIGSGNLVWVAVTGGMCRISRRELSRREVGV